MTALAPLRASNGYIGLGKQSVIGNAVSPTIFPRWRDGSVLSVELKAEDVEEGDTSAQLSAIIKNEQSVKIKLIFVARPIIAGFVETAALRSGSDTYTGPTVSTTTSSVLALGATANTTLNGAVAAGATSIVVTSNTGFTPSGFSIPVILDAGTNVSEVVTLTSAASGTTFTVTALKFAHASGATVQTPAGFTLAANTGLTASATKALCLDAGLSTQEFITILTPGVGSGPYSYYMNSNTTSGAFAQTHTNGGNVQSTAQHAISDQAGNCNPYTIEFGFGTTSGKSMVLRVRDCMPTMCKRSGSKGGLWIYDTDWVGTATTLQASPSSVTLEIGNPFLYTQIQGGVTLDVSTGETAYLENLDISTNNNVELIQTELLTPDAPLADAIRTDLSWTSVWQTSQSQNRMANVLMGGINGTSDAQTILNNPITVVLAQPDKFNQITYSIPNINNVKYTMPALKAKGGHFAQQVDCSATNAQGANTNIMTVTVLNTQNSAYG